MSDRDAAELPTRATALFGVRHPVVQTGMGWVSGVHLTSATAAAGGLGVLASATMTLEELDAAIAEVRERTDAPFGVNLLPAQVDASERISLIVDRGVRVASFAAAPRPDQVERLRDAGVVTIVTVGAPRHAEKVAALGVSAVIAQGAEGGGHTGSIPTSLLVPQVVDAVRRVGGDDPMVVLAAGGFHDGRGLATALRWGADGIAMGTRFLLTAESRVAQEAKAAYLASGLTDTVVTSAIDGAPQRVVRTPFVERLERSSGIRRLAVAGVNGLRFARRQGIAPLDLLRTAKRMHDDHDQPWAQVLMAANAPMMTRSSVVEGDLEVGILPTGQVVGLIDDLPSVEDLVARIVAGAVAELGSATSAGDGDGRARSTTSPPTEAEDDDRWT